MNSSEIRQRYLQFFEKNKHTIVASSSVIPAEDPTILFTNAGMNQFKDCFLGKEKRTYVRATSSQKCVRAGGKHNDLENVGFTARHLTFFEMLANFSFGDYFKKEAIDFAWRFLTEELEIPAERLYATVFEKDDEAYELWHTVTGMPYERISRLGEKDNFWAMGDVGPCGPCTEIYYDRGESYGTGPENQAPGGSGERFIEIWNLVFMQYNRLVNGTLEPLAQTGVDTGMGLERLAAVLQDKKTVFHIDMFASMQQEISKLTGIDYASASADKQAAFHVLCDHIRSTSFMIADGGAPSNEGRGYVLRKIIRRAALFAQKLSLKPFFHLLVSTLAQTMGKAYPELITNQALIMTVLESEVEKFASSLLVGKNMFEKYVEQLRLEKKNILSGIQAFKLYDTYGFPLELTKVLAHENNLIVDEEGFNQQMLLQQSASGKKAKHQEELNLPATIATEFIGYQAVEAEGTIVWSQINDDQTAWIVTDVSPFYVESGGQVSDQGHILVDGIECRLLQLKKIVTAPNQVAIAALCQVQEAQLKNISVGKKIICVVNAELRANTVRNHTATHMLQAALIEVLGNTVKQAGSVVEPDYLRFDFSFHRAMTDAEIALIEMKINNKIQENIATEIVNTTLEEAQKKGAKAFFGEKYNPENVRVVSIPGFSTELCGGTHASATGIIGMFKILSEASLATGVRRIVAITGPAALTLFQTLYKSTKSMSEQYKTQIEEVLPAVKKQSEQLSAALSEIKQLKKKLIETSIGTWIEQMQPLNQIPFLALALNEVNADEFKIVTEKINAQKQGIILVTSMKDGRCSYYLSMSPALKIKGTLKDAQQYLMQACGVKGGGSGLMIQGSGLVKHEPLVAALKQWIEAQ